MQDKFEKKHTYTPEQKQEWFGEGEWITEPDHVHFTYKGYECVVKRVCLREPCEEFFMFGGYLCGYVLIPVNHPYREKEYAEMTIDCHYGLTYAEDFWIGFDCAHCGDYVPSVEKLKKEKKILLDPFPLPEEFKEYAIFNPVYRNIEFCIDECKSIVDQLIEVK